MESEEKKHKKQIFGYTKSIPLGSVNNIRFGPRSKDSGLVDYKNAKEKERIYNTNLGIVTFETELGKIGLDRKVLSAIDRSQISSIGDISRLIEPQPESVDPRTHQEKVIYKVNPELSSLVGKDLVVKYNNKSGDNLLPQQQFEASKIIQKAVIEANISDIVEVNKAIGFVQNADAGYLFLEKVNGYNIKELESGSCGEIPADFLNQIFTRFNDNLNILKDSIENDPDFILAKQISKENNLENLMRRLKYINQKADFNPKHRESISETYPNGFDKSSKSFVVYFADKSYMLDSINSFLKKIDQLSQTTDKKEVNYLISELIWFLMNQTGVSSAWINDIHKHKDYGQDNLMYDFDKQKIIIVDPGPVLSGT